MKKITATILLLSMMMCSAFAQQKDTSISAKPAIVHVSNKINWYSKVVTRPLSSHELNKDTSRFEKTQLFIYKISGNDNVYNAMPFFNLIEQKDLVSIEALKNKTATDRYGPNGKNGVYIITLKQGTEILPADKLLDKYNIKAKFKKLPVYIDSNLTGNTDKMYYCLTKIKSITVAKEKQTGMKYISILSDNYDIFKQ